MSPDDGLGPRSSSSANVAVFFFLLLAGGSGGGNEDVVGRVEEILLRGVQRMDAGSFT